MADNQNNRAAETGQTAGQGALAGSIATFPVTASMLATHRLLPEDQRYHLPPEILVRECSQRTHLNWHLDKRLTLGATTISHFGYGAAMGALYSPLEKKKLLPAPLQDTLFGLLVWAGSYLVLLPLKGIWHFLRKSLPISRPIAYTACNRLTPKSLYFCESMSASLPFRLFRRLIRAASPIKPRASACGACGWER